MKRQAVQTSQLFGYIVAASSNSQQSRRMTIQRRMHLEKDFLVTLDSGNSQAFLQSSVPANKRGEIKEREKGGRRVMRAERAFFFLTYTTAIRIVALRCQQTIDGNFSVSAT